MIDVDFEEIEEISNMSAKKIAHQMKLKGFATTKDSSISWKISKCMPEFRDKHNPKILIGPDRHMKQKMIMINPNLSDPDKEIKKFIKGMIKIF